MSCRLMTNECAESAFQMPCLEFPEVGIIKTAQIISEVDDSVGENKDSFLTQSHNWMQIACCNFL